jgi:hypothetical protein
MYIQHREVFSNSLATRTVSTLPVSYAAYTFSRPLCAVSRRERTRATDDVTRGYTYGPVGIYGPCYHRSRFPLECSIGQHQRVDVSSVTVYQTLYAVLLGSPICQEFFKYNHVLTRLH